MREGKREEDEEGRKEKREGEREIKRIEKVSMTG